MILDKTTLKRYSIVLLGSLLFCIGFNGFIVPLNLYSGGTMGVSQLISTLLIDYAHIDSLKNFNTSGLINFALNVPLFYLGYKAIGKVFCVRTAFSVATQALLISIVPVPSVPIVNDILTSCLVGGIIAGVGIGITLRAGASTGGADVIGLYLTKKKNDFSVGKFTLYFNSCIYIICILLLNLQTGIYSIIFSIAITSTIDRIHYQNINMNVMIFTKVENMHKKIIFDLHRGVTHWNGFGGYTNDDTHILLTVVSKYEIEKLKEAVLDVDPKAFIILNEGSQITGNYEKRL